MGHGPPSRSRKEPLGPRSSLPYVRNYGMRMGSSGHPNALAQRLCTIPPCPGRSDLSIAFGTRLRLPAPIVADLPLWEDSRDFLELQTLTNTDTSLFIS